MYRRASLIATTLCTSISVVLFMGGSAYAAHPKEPKVSNTIFASGLNNPRGLKFGPDGKLYVAEGGIGGTQLPPNDPNCVVVPPVGPYLGSPTGSRISRIDEDGHRTTVVDGLPSSQTSADLGSLVSGVADIAFVGRRMYAILAGAGCSHGVPSVPNAVIRVHRNGTWNIVANLGAYQRAHPVANPEPDDFEPDGTWYSMQALHGDLYAVEPNHGEIVRVTTDGNIKRIVDVSATQGHVVPTALAHHGIFYVGNLGIFPQDQGTSKVWALTPSGHLRLVASGFNMILGLAFDRRDRMYVLEMSAAPAPTPGTGRITRLSPSGKHRTVLVDDLFLPTGMTIGPDGALYVSNVGFGAPPVGLGEVRKIEVNED